MPAEDPGDVFKVTDRRRRQDVEDSPQPAASEAEAPPTPVPPGPPAERSLTQLPSAIDLDVVTTKTARVIWEQKLDFDIRRLQEHIRELPRGDGRRAALQNQLAALQAQLRGPALAEVLGIEPEPPQAPAGAITASIVYPAGAGGGGTPST